MSVNLFLAKESKRDLLGAMGGRPAAEEVSLIRSRPKTVNVPPKPLSQAAQVTAGPKNDLVSKQTVSRQSKTT